MSTNEVMLSRYILNVGDNFYWGGIEKTCGFPMTLWLWSAGAFTVFFLAVESCKDHVCLTKTLSITFLTWPVSGSNTCLKQLRNMLSYPAKHQFDQIFEGIYQGPGLSLLTECSRAMIFFHNVAQVVEPLELKLVGVNIPSGKKLEAESLGLVCWETMTGEDSDLTMV